MQPEPDPPVNLNRPEVPQGVEEELCSVQLAVLILLVVFVVFVRFNGSQPFRMKELFDWLN